MKLKEKREDGRGKDKDEKNKGEENRMANKKAEELLPIGTIVLLNNGQKRLMIVGRFAIKNDSDELFDYLGCLYPEGIISDKTNFLFNDSDIKEVVYKGFTDEEDEDFKKQIGVLLEKRTKES